MKAFELLSMMEQKSVHRGTTTYHAALSACGVANGRTLLHIYYYLVPKDIHNIFNARTHAAHSWMRSFGPYLFM